MSDTPVKYTAPNLTTPSCMGCSFGGSGPIKRCIKSKNCCGRKKYRSISFVVFSLFFMVVFDDHFQSSSVANSSRFFVGFFLGLLF